MKTPMPQVDPSLFMPAVYAGPPAVEDRVWHYTSSFTAKRIVAAGALRPQPQRYMDREAPPGTQPLLWCSKNHIFEPASLHEVRSHTWEWQGERRPKILTFDGLRAFGARPVRFAVPAALVPYSHHAAFKLAGYGMTISRHLERVGEQLGGRLDDWRGTLDAVTKEDWLSIEVWNGTQCLWEVVWHP